MKRAYFVILSLLSAVMFAAVVPSGRAQMERVRIHVDGLACPFCAYGLEKNLKALKGIESVKIEMDEGLATLAVKKDERVSLDKVRSAINDSGFTPRETDLTASGRITTLEALADDDEAMTMVAEIRKAAEEQEIDLPTNAYVLVLGEPRELFLLLRAKEDEEAQRSFDALPSAVEADEPMTITGIIPETDKKAKKALRTVFVRSVKQAKKVG